MLSTRDSGCGYLAPVSTTLFVSFQDCLYSDYSVVSFHGLYAVCSRVGAPRNLLFLKPFTFLGTGSRSAEGKKTVPWKPLMDPNGVPKLVWESGQWIVIEQARNSSNIVVPWLPMFRFSASLGPSIMQFTYEVFCLYLLGLSARCRKRPSFGGSLAHRVFIIYLGLPTPKKYQSFCTIRRFIKFMVVSSVSRKS